MRAGALLFRPVKVENMAIESKTPGRCPGVFVSGAVCLQNMELRLIQGARALSGGIPLGVAGLAPAADCQHEHRINLVDMAIQGYMPM